MDNNEKALAANAMLNEFEKAVRTAAQLREKMFLMEDELVKKSLDYSWGHELSKISHWRGKILELVKEEAQNG